MEIDYNKITDNPEVVKLLKQRLELESKIKSIDEKALIKHELQLLGLDDDELCVETEDCEKSFTSKQVIEILDDSETLDDAKMFFTWNNKLNAY